MSNVRISFIRKQPQNSHWNLPNNVTNISAQYWHNPPQYFSDHFAVNNTWSKCAASKRAVCISKVVRSWDKQVSNWCFTNMNGTHVSVLPYPLPRSYSLWTFYPSNNLSHLTWHQLLSQIENFWYLAKTRSLDKYFLICVFFLHLEHKHHLILNFCCSYYLLEFSFYAQYQDWKIIIWDDFIKNKILALTLCSSLLVMFTFE